MRAPVGDGSGFATVLSVPVDHVHVEYIASTERNPFGLVPPCEQYVPGCGDTRADFHVVGDNPAVHGGLSTGIPFTDRSWSRTFFETFQRAGLVQDVDLAGGEIASFRTFFSYLHMCEPDGPGGDSYAAMEPYFDAELRAITAHSLLPVGSRATAHVLRSYTARAPETSAEMDDLHASEIHGSGWLVVPIKDPSEWTDGDAEALVERIRSFEESDYRQLSDLGRFIAGAEPYLVR